MPSQRKGSQPTESESTPKDNAPVDSIRLTVHDPSQAGRHWYAVHTYSGYENKVKNQLEARSTVMHLNDRIFQILVPIEEVVEIRNGERRTVKRKIYPSYILVDMILDEESWHCVKETPGVTSFVGGASATEPIPLQDHEMEVILRQTKKVEEGKTQVIMPKFTIGQSVKIIDGPFSEFIGQISEVNPERNKLTVLVSFFNRETPVELDYLQVEKV